MGPRSEGAQSMREPWVGQMTSLERAGLPFISEVATSVSEWKRFHRARLENVADIFV
jgi:hypothetical protein